MQKKNAFPTTPCIVVLALFSTFSCSNTGIDEALIQPFIGSWLNQDVYQGGISEVAIRYDDGKALVEAWYHCQPTECETEEVLASYRADADELFATWVYGSSSTLEAIITLAADNTIQGISKNSSIRRVDINKVIC
jgi:hypothetical protein